MEDRKTGNIECLNVAKGKAEDRKFLPLVFSQTEDKLMSARVNTITGYFVAIRDSLSQL